MPEELRSTHIGRAASEIGAFKWLCKNHPKWVVVILIVLVATYAYLIYTNRRLSSKNSGLEKKADKLEQRLAPVEAILAKSFPNADDRERLDLLIRSIEELNTKYGSFDLRRADALEFAAAARDFAASYEKQHKKKPAVKLILYEAASDASGRLFEQFRNALVDAGWNVETSSDTMVHLSERGLWVFTKTPLSPSETAVFFSNLFMKFGVNVKPATWAGDLDKDAAVVLVNDPTYLR